MRREEKSFGGGTISVEIACLRALPNDVDEAPFWIDEVIAAFCSEQKLIDRWRAAGAESS
jgi:hypothetical protein